MNKKIFMYTGKGGVGKSTISSATAIISAKKNINTILISIDQAHSLSDVFGIKIGGEITKVCDNLSVVEIDSSKILEERFPDIKAGLADRFRKIDFSKVSYNSSVDMPFIANILSLLKILDIYEQFDFENIIVDCPASASTFAYLKIPEMLSWYLEKFFGIGKGIIRTLRPVSKYKYKINLPDNQSLDEIEIIYKRLIKLEEILKDSRISTVRLVGLAEKMVLEESKRDLSYLNLFDYNVDGFFVNRLFDDDKSDFVRKRIEIQSKHLKEIEDCFYNMPVYKIKLMKKDLINLEDIEKFAEELSFKDSILDIKPICESYSYEKIDDGYILRINISKIHDYDVYKKGTDINIRVDDMKRIISLPNILIDSYIHKCVRNNDELYIYLKVKQDKI